MEEYRCFLAEVEWGGYSRGYDNYSIKARSKEEAEKIIEEFVKSDCDVSDLGIEYLGKTTVRDDTEKSGDFFIRG